MTFAIHTGITKPVRSNCVPKGGAYPFGTMNVGDMFHVPHGDDSNVKVQRRLQSAATSFKKHNPGHKFSMRSIEMHGVPGVGVWRDQ